MQGVAGDVVMEAGVRLAMRRNLWPVLQVHDELAFVVRDDEVQCALQYIADEMRRTPEWMPWLPLDVEADVGQNLGDMWVVPV